MMDTLVINDKEYQIKNEISINNFNYVFLKHNEVLLSAEKIKYGENEMIVIPFTKQTNSRSKDYQITQHLINHFLELIKNDDFDIKFIKFKDIVDNSKQIRYYLNVSNFDDNKFKLQINDMYNCLKEELANNYSNNSNSDYITDPSYISYMQRNGC